MNTPNLIRAGIFLTAAILLHFYPGHMFRFQSYIVNKTKIKYDFVKERAYYSLYSLGLTLISLIFFYFAINY